MALSVPPGPQRRSSSSRPPFPRTAYLSTLANPGTFRIMVYGTVPVEFARKKYPKWMKEIGKM